jgi:type IV pilus assembly protein PilA
MKQDGFTLVELMAVTAIIGLLSAIAVPNYHKFQARARQSEAKISLAAIYTVEKAFAIEQNSYTTCLAEVGFGMESTKTYYSIGYSTPAVACGDGTEDCHQRTFGTAPLNCTAGAFPAGGYFPAAVGYGGPISHVAFNAAVPSTIDNGTFTVGAAGHISTTGLTDVWTINERRALVNLRPGL